MAGAVYNGRQVNPPWVLDPTRRVTGVQWAKNEIFVGGTGVWSENIYGAHARDAGSVTPVRVDFVDGMDFEQKDAQTAFDESGVSGPFDVDRYVGDDPDGNFLQLVYRGYNHADAVFKNETLKTGPLGQTVCRIKVDPGPTSAAFHFSEIDPRIDTVVSTANQAQVFQGDVRSVKLEDDNSRKYDFGFSLSNSGDSFAPISVASCQIIYDRLNYKGRVIPIVWPRTGGDTYEANLRLDGMDEPQPRSWKSIPVGSPPPDVFGRR